MSESATFQRPLGGAEEFDRRIRSIQQPAAPALGETLAELARLVGDDDPFRNVPATAAPASAPLPVPRPRYDDQPVDPDFAAFDAELRGGIDAGEASGAPDNPAVVHPPVDHADAWPRSTPRFAAVSARDQRPIEPSPDVWARGADDGLDGEPVLTATRDAPPPGTGGARRTMVVLAAVVVLTGGGLAASLLTRPSSATIAAATAAAPTIMAATGPSKVKPETPVAGDDTASQPSTLLDKNSNDGTAAAKVVNTVEQPVDLNQAIKPAASAEPPQPDAPPASAFPEPRKVKTVIVRPDGTIIADATAATDAPAEAAAPSAASLQAALAFDPNTALPISPRAPAAAPPDAAAVDAAPVKPAAPAKVTARAKPMTSTSAAGTAASQSRTPDATPKVAKPAKPKVAHAAAKPADVAGATATPPATPDVVASAAPPPADVTSAVPAATGSFSVQLGAEPSEAEGRQAASRLGAKYAADLGGAKPGVVKAAAGGKTVYRIRVGAMSHDDAIALCEKIKAGGGGCFLARN